MCSACDLKSIQIRHSQTKSQPDGPADQLRQREAGRLPEAIIAWRSVGETGVGGAYPTECNTLEDRPHSSYNRGLRRATGKATGPLARHPLSHGCPFRGNTIQADFPHESPAGGSEPFFRLDIPAGPVRTRSSQSHDGQAVPPCEDGTKSRCTSDQRHESSCGPASAVADGAGSRRDDVGA